MDHDTRPDRAALLALAMLCVATVLLVPLERFASGATCWLAGVAALARCPREEVRRRLGVLFACVAALAVAPINTDRGTAHIAHLALYFAAVVAIPSWLLRREPGVIEWRWWPNRFQWRDVLYVLIATPLAWGIIRIYFFRINPDLPTHWPMPIPTTPDARARLFAGINAVGIWDELFFVNTVYGILRSLLPAGLANLAQSVVYTSVLTHMAFTGIGPVVVYGFALTQGVMYERSRCLLYVLIVHLIVDAFLVAAILQYYDPAHSPRWF